MFTDKYAAEAHEQSPHDKQSRSDLDGFCFFGVFVFIDAECPNHAERKSHGVGCVSGEKTVGVARMRFLQDMQATCDDVRIVAGAQARKEILEQIGGLVHAYDGRRKRRGDW